MPLWLPPGRFHCGLVHLEVEVRPTVVKHVLTLADCVTGAPPAFATPQPPLCRSPRKPLVHGAVIQGITFILLLFCKFKLFAIRIQRPIMRPKTIKLSNVLAPWNTDMCTTPTPGVINQESVMRCARLGDTLK